MDTVTCPKKNGNLVIAMGAGPRVKNIMKVQGNEGTTGFWDLTTV